MIMATKRNRYKEMERYMTYALCIDVFIFILYLLFAGLGIVWLKVIFAILALILSGIMLAYLYLTKEILKRRSLWISSGAAAIAVCVLFSLILNFPSPKPQITPLEGESSYYISSELL